MARQHLAIFLKSGAEKILRGEKQVEIRLSQSRIPPYGVICKGDEIYLKDAGGLVTGKVIVENVLFYDSLTPEMIGNIRREYAEVSRLNDDFWQFKAQARYASIIFLKTPRQFLTPFAFHKNDRRGWLVFEENLRLL
ncbi:MAG TPA: hypothetical protein VJK26_03525 [Patescibacteria group bacterium]|nr:hypothetical protein [Patescibacteria group bacterium]